MKQFYMFKSLLIACIMMLFGGGNFAFAQEETEITSFSSISGDINSYISYSCAKGNGTNPPAVNNNNIRLYKPASGKTSGCFVKISAASGYTINSVVFGVGTKGGSVACMTGTDTPTSSTPKTSISNNSTSEFTDINSTDVTFYNVGTDRIDLKSLKVIYTAISTDPAITASDVEYAADILNGEIPYTISNPVEGTNLTATTTTEWISDVTVGESAVTFTMAENTGAERTGTITLSYGKLTKDITVKQSAAVAKRTVTIETPANGTLKVFRDAEEIISGAQIPEGTELTIEATPSEGYKFRNWQAVDASTHTYTANFTYTIGTSDVTFKANFDAIVYNTITWNVNGVESTTTVEQGSDITFTAPETVPDGYTFMGWLGETYGPSDEAPAFVTSAKAAGDVTYYAVFAKGSGAEETATLTASHTKESTGYAAHTYTDDKENTWTTYSNEQGAVANGDARFGLNKNTGYYFGSPLFSGNVTKIVMNVYNGSSSSTRTFYIDSEQTNQNGDLGTIAVAGGEKKVDKEITFDGQFNQFYIHSSDALSFLYIKVTYGSKTYTGYTTTVSDEPTTGTFTFVAQDADGNYYATFSTDHYIVFPEEVEISAVNGINEDGTLKYFVKTPDETPVTDEVGSVKGSLVPKNTGVLLKSSKAEVTYYFPISDVTESIYSWFKPVTNEDGTFEGREGYKYYKLAYNDYEAKTGLGFYWGAENGAPFKSKKGLAYLEIPETTTSGAAPTHFLIGGGTDGISNVKSDVKADKDGVIYNIAGQRVNAATKPGLYIIDGKKVVVK